LNYAVDRKRIVETLLRGVGKPQSLPWSDGSPAFEAAKMERFGFDLDKANSLLAQAGASDLTVDIIPNPGNPESADLAQVYQADLAKIGVKLNILKLEMAVWSDQVNGRKYKGLYYASSAQLQLSPGTAYTARPLNPDDNNEGFKSDAYASLVAAALTETDAAKLKQIYSQINDIILDESFVMYVTPNTLTLLARAGVQSITPHLHGGWLLTDTWLAA
jgi:peptide/nickel transport system substrate-binding protein